MARAKAIVALSPPPALTPFGTTAQSLKNMTTAGLESMISA
jgi:hypothetical protein